MTEIGTSNPVLIMPVASYCPAVYYLVSPVGADTTVY